MVLKVALFCPEWPYPPRKGYQRIIAERIDGLSKSCSIDLYCLNTTFPNLSPWINSGHPKENLFVVKINRPIQILKALFKFIYGKPGQVGLYESESLQNLIAVNHGIKNYDVMIFMTIRMAQYLPPNFNGVSILEMVDPLSISYIRSLSWRKGLVGLLYKAEALRLRAYERSILSKFSYGTLISEKDTIEMSEVTKSDNLKTIQYGVNTDYFYQANISDAIKNQIIMTGNFGYAPNYESAVYFCLQVLPLILQSKPDATFFIVGTNPTPLIKKLHNGKSIFVTGEVPDIRIYLEKSSVAVCPVRQQIGMQTKILEALSMGIPVVASNEAFECFDELSLPPISRAKNDKDFALQVVKELNSRNRKAKSDQCRNYILENYTWNVSNNALLRLFNPY
jgi:glycosyltransferase involved in cell wall biosynthesis